jgi:hypothetical protein
MTLALLTMSRRELDRAEWMQQIRERRRTQMQVADRLGLSVRQVERLYRAYKAHGAAGIISKKRGRPSSRRLPDAMRTEVVALVRERYADFGPTLAHEKVTESHGAKVSVETLRQWMIAEDIWLPRAQRAPRAHQPRRRRFEERAPRCVLLVYVDDATSY